MTLTQKRLRELLEYNPDTGKFVWLQKRCWRIEIGHLAGSLRKDRYWGIKLDGTLYLAHRLAFLYMIGRFPKEDVDHINRVRGDDRWCNLREATRAQNQVNRLKSRNGLKGAFPTYHTGTYQSAISVNGKIKYLGHFKTELEAHQAYMKAARKYYGEFALSE